jgi:hypothetical protein
VNLSNAAWIDEARASKRRNERERNSNNNNVVKYFVDRELHLPANDRSHCSLGRRPFESIGNEIEKKCALVVAHKKGDD